MKNGAGFQKLIKSNKIIIFDGAMGTMLQQESFSSGICPELYNLSHPHIIRKIHQAYLTAGAQVITTNTFGANRLKLAVYHLENKIEKIIKAAANIAKDAAQPQAAMIAGDIGPLGELLEPIGKISFSQAVDVFAQQALFLKKAGCDCLLLETITDLQEMRAAIIAAKETKLPVIASMTFEPLGRTMTGTDPQTAAVVLQALGADVIGANCSSGPKELIAVARQMIEAVAVPVLIQPNAGLPKLVNGQTVFPLNAEEFASFAPEFARLGVKFLGGCCGTTPEHIKKLKAESWKLKIKIKHRNAKTYLTSRTKTVEIGQSPVIIGERINPTARKTLAQALKNKNYSLLLQEAKSQVTAGCDLLDVNVSVPNTDERETIKRMMFDLSTVVDKPLVLDSPDQAVIEEGLKNYPGKALVNSVTGEKQKLKKILPLVKKYGAAIVGLCIDEQGIGQTWEKRVKIAGKIIKETDKNGIARQDVFIDCLTLSISAEPSGVTQTLKAISALKQKYGVRTILGVSNVSHGLPNRSLINTAFLSMAIAAGLDAVIMNPLDEKMQETLAAATYLAGRDINGQKYLSKFSDQIKVAMQGTGFQDTNLKQKIIIGDKDGIIKLVERDLQTLKPMEIINQQIIPALEEVGQRYEKKEYFLPQLMMSAECAQVAMKHLQQELSKDKETKTAKEQNPTLIFATVKGDVHDIGKNIVVAVLQNYGYRIIDLGKDVPAEKIAAAAKKYKADVVCLSALMTTTMTEMPKVIQLLKKQSPKTKVVIGGAVVTADYAVGIGAEGYGKDAVDTARVIKQLTERSKQ